jgi:hypothetical protein
MQMGCGGQESGVRRESLVRSPEGGSPEGESPEGGSPEGATPISKTKNP